VRLDLNRKVSKLDPRDTNGRTQLKAEARASTPREVRAVIEARRPGLAPPPGTGGRANVTNMRANGAAAELGAAGRGFAVLNVALSAHDVATSDNPMRAGIANVGAAIGGLYGGEAGALAGTLGGPFAEVTVPAGALGGAALGGNFGYKAGENLYDLFAGH
jgi:hypothetical protein